MAQDILPPPSHIKMTKPNSCNFNSMFLFPSTNPEVCSIIDRLKTKRAQRYTVVETKFIKYGKLIISPIISNLFNLCVETGVLPNCLKIDKQKNQLIFFHVYLKHWDSSTLLFVESNFGFRLTTQ